MSTVTQPKGPLNKTALAAHVARELGGTVDDGHRAIDAVLNTITRALAAGQSVTVTNFGSWHAVDRPERTARNPKTGQPVIVPAHRTIRVLASSHLRRIVRAGDTTASIRKRPSK